MVIYIEIHGKKTTTICRHQAIDIITHKYVTLLLLFKRYVSNTVILYTYIHIVYEKHDNHKQFKSYTRKLYSDEICSYIY